MMTQYGVSLSLLPALVKQRVARTMVMVMEDNIEHFLSYKRSIFKINVETFAEDFERFAKEISADSDVVDWKNQFKKPMNTSDEY